MKPKKSKTPIEKAPAKEAEPTAIPRCCQTCALIGNGECPRDIPPTRAGLDLPCKTGDKDSYKAR